MNEAGELAKNIDKHKAGAGRDNKPAHFMQNVRKTTAARGFAVMIGEGSVANKRAIISIVKTYGQAFARRVETYVWQYVQDQTFARSARN